MFKPSKKQISSLIGGTALLGIVAILAYAAVLFNPAAQPIGYVGQPTMSNFNVTTGNETVYRGVYINSDWSGLFTCYPVSATGYVNIPSPCFASGASSPLDAQALANTRLIGTLSDATTPAGVEFSTTGLTAAQQTALGTTANINWIRGTSLSPTGLRARTTVLGDIIHSRPYYWADKVNSGANPTVFVGANDGMLHAFNATTGAERWAYVPSMLISSSKMALLPATTYQHDYFVDGGIAIGNIPSSGTTPTQVLVSALGAGGKGLFALKLASLTATTGASVGAKAMWEITNTAIKCGPAASTGCTNGATTAYANLGYTYSNPVIVPTQDGNNSVIMGNGYNNTGNGHATLYVINAATGALIKEIDTMVGTTTSPNGLSSVTAISSNGNGYADRVYAGDINGNMWVFDLSSASSSNWKVAILSGSTPQPLYSVPQGTAAEPIAITMAPALSVHPFGGYMVNFATGRILSQAGAVTISPSTTAAIDDTTDTTIPYAAYGLWDNPAVNTTIATSSLITQSITANNYTPPTGSPSTTVIPVINFTTNNKPDWGVNRGWRVPLALTGGERVTGDSAFVDSGKFVFNVTNPAIAYTPPGGSTSTFGVNYLLQLDYLYGGPGTVPFMDLNQDSMIGSSDLLTSGGTSGIAETLIPVGYLTSNGVQSQPILVQLAQTRIPLYNQNYNQVDVPSKTTGVNGGHFDVDIFYLVSTTFQKVAHVHEYDKLYDTNGLNLLNPNNSTYPLSTVNGMSSTTTYKVLVMNQGWNRGMNLRIGTWSGSTKSYQTMLSTDAITQYITANCTGANTTNLGVGCLDVANLPTFNGTISKVGHLSGGTLVSTSGTDYTVVPSNTTSDIAGKINILNVVTTGTIGCTNGATGVATTGCSSTTQTAGARASVGGLELSMPSNGYDIKDWWAYGDGVVSTGVMPTLYSCAYGVNSNGTMPAQSGTNYYTGPNGERHDGVLTMQIIKSTTPNSDVQMNVPGKPIYGFRVIDSMITTDVIAEYTLYWHHPNRVCMGDTSSTWATTNNEGDPWWPAQATTPTGFSSSTTNSTSTTKGILTCVSGGPNSASNGPPTWNSTAYTAANTSPYTGAFGSSAGGPAGWTITPPQDTATTLPPCPTYTATKDDPRTASFVFTTPGTGSGTTTPGTILPPTSGLGGKPLPPPTPPGGTGTSPPAASGVPPTYNQSGGQPAPGRINWRELIAP